MRLQPGFGHQKSDARYVSFLNLTSSFRAFGNHTCERATLGVTVLTLVVRTVEDETATKVAPGMEVLGTDELVIAAGMEELVMTATGLDVVAGAEAEELGAADAQRA